MSEPVSPDGTIVVVGASLAGLRAAEEIRHEGHPGPVIIVGEEVHAPYDRPPLSNRCCRANGRWSGSTTTPRTPRMPWDSSSASGAGPRASTPTPAPLPVTTDRRSHYDGLVVATGAATRALSGTEGMAGV